MWSSLLQHPGQQLFKLGKIGIFARKSRLLLVGAAEGGQFDTNIRASPAAASA
jgi:hypothetical protein